MPAYLEAYMLMTYASDDGTGTYQGPGWACPTGTRMFVDLTPDLAATLDTDQATFVIEATQELATLNAVARGEQPLPAAHDFRTLVGVFTGLD